MTDMWYINGWVADTANNQYGNYLFNLDTTKFSDGEHLLGVKLTNSDGYDYTTWYTIHINNFKSHLETATNPTISGMNDSLHIEGWAVDKSGITNVEYVVKGGNSGYCTRGERKDVSAAYPGYTTGSEAFKIDIPYDGIVTYKVQYSNHNNEKGLYYTHVYAYDEYGNANIQIDLSAGTSSKSVLKSLKIYRDSEKLQEYHDYDGSNCFAVDSTVYFGEVVENAISGKVLVFRDGILQGESALETSNKPQFFKFRNMAAGKWKIKTIVTSSWGESTIYYDKISVIDKTNNITYNSIRRLLLHMLILLLETKSNILNQIITFIFKKLLYGLNSNHCI